MRNPLDTWLAPVSHLEIALPFPKHVVRNRTHVLADQHGHAPRGTSRPVLDVRRSRAAAQCRAGGANGVVRAAQLPRTRARYSPMNIEHDHFVRGLVLRHRRTVLIDRLGCWVVRDGRVIAGMRWWRY